MSKVKSKKQKDPPMSVFECFLAAMSTEELLEQYAILSDCYDKESKEALPLYQAELRRRGEID